MLNLAFVEVCSWTRVVILGCSIRPLLHAFCRYTTLWVTIDTFRICRGVPNFYSLPTHVTTGPHCLYFGLAHTRGPRRVSLLGARQLIWSLSSSMVTRNVSASLDVLIQRRFPPGTLTDQYSHLLLSLSIAVEQFRDGRQVWRSSQRSGKRAESLGTDCFRLR